MSGSNALQITDPNADNPLAQAPSWADAAQSVAGTVSSGVDALGQWLAAQRAKQQQPPMWSMANPVGTETTRQPQQLTMPTPGVQDVAFWGGQPVSQQFKDTAQSAIGNALGWVGSAGPSEGGFSLEKVQRRPLAPPNEHIWKIKDPAGGDAGTIDTTWNPDTGNLHIEDFQSVGGPNTLGLTAIRQLHSALLDQYPGVKTLSGLRISGATYADRPSGSGPGRYAIRPVPSAEMLANMPPNTARVPPDTMSDVNRTAGFAPVDVGNEVTSPIYPSNDTQLVDRLINYDARGHSDDYAAAIQRAMDIRRRLGRQ